MTRSALAATITLAFGLAFGAATAPAAVPSGPSCPSPNGDAYSQAVLADNPVGYFRLDETAGPTLCDLSSEANDGTYSSSGITYGVPGALPASADTAIALDGTGAVGQSGANVAGITGNHDFTLEAWFKNTEAAPYTNHVLVALGLGSGTTSSGQLAELSLYPHHNQQLGRGPSSCFGIDQQGADYCWDPTTVGINIWDGNWHYLAVTYDQSTGTFTGYVDDHDLGAPVSDQYGNPPVDIAAAPVSIGPVSGGSNPYFKPLNGGLDDVAVYPTALSSARIAAHQAAASEARLTVSASGPGTVTSSPSNIDCGNGDTQCSADFPAGTQVTLTATPAAGSTFTGWSGGGCSGTGTCEVTMSSTQSVTATFSSVAPPETLSIGTAGTGSGTVTGPGISCPGTCSASYPQGSQVTLTAIPAAGSTFVGWSGGGCSGTGTCSLTMGSPQTITATFDAMRPLTLSLAGTGSGTVSGPGVSCPGACVAAYPLGASVTLSARPAVGSRFAGWSGGGCSGTASTCTVPMSDAEQVTAAFDSLQYAPPRSGFRLLSHGDSDGVLLPSGNRGLPVDTRGACVLTISEGSASGARAAIAQAKRGHRRHAARKGLIRTYRVVVASAGRHVVPVIPTAKEIRLWRAQRPRPRVRGNSSGRSSAVRAG